MDGNAATPHRVAIYYAPPPNSVWWQRGSAWLGRCAHTGLTLPALDMPGVTSEQWLALTADPRRYGWHATLKAPFALNNGCTLDDVRNTVRQLCTGREPFDLAPLQVSRMGTFLALRPLQIQTRLAHLAADCVRQLHPLSRALSDTELARRRRTPLTPEQDQLLRAWGYPYVLDQFRFHLSLTGALSELPVATLATIMETAADYFHPLPACHIDRLSIFVEPTPGAPFRLLEQIGFAP